jgi:hypothetical protein
MARILTDFFIVLIRAIRVQIFVICNGLYLNLD